MSAAETLYTLYADYGRYHFLINRGQVPASVYAEYPMPWDSGFPFFEDLLSLEDEEVPLFNLHRYLCSLFTLEEGIKDLLVLLIPLELIDSQSLAVLKAGPLADRPKVRRLGIRVSSETKIRTVALSEMAAHDRILHRALKNRGLPAVHPQREPLRGEESLGFLVDPARAAAALCRSREAR